MAATDAQDGLPRVNPSELEEISLNDNAKSQTDAVGGTEKPHESPGALKEAQPVKDVAHGTAKEAAEEPAKELPVSDPKIEPADSMESSQSPETDLGSNSEEDAASLQKETGTVPVNGAPAGAANGSVPKPASGPLPASGSTPVDETPGSTPVDETPAPDDKTPAGSTPVHAAPASGSTPSKTTPARAPSAIPSNSGSPRRPRSASVRRSKTAAAALTQSVVNGAEAKPAKIFLQTAMTKIRDSKDAKRMPALQKAAARAVEAFASGSELPQPRVLLDALKLVCVPPGASNELKETAIDALGQLFSLNYFAIAEGSDSASPAATLADAVHIVCDSWEAEGADQRVELQIIKALTQAVVNEDLVVHGSVLMRAVRQVYHIFVVTRSQMNQGLAQGSLTQMVQVVFERVKMYTSKSPAHTPLESSDNLAELASDAGNTTVDQTLTLKDIKAAHLPDEDDSQELRTELENTTQDAGLLFRTLCRLATKTIDESDLRSQQMRSKLLSLHLLHMILKHHISVFKNHDVCVHKNRQDVEPLAYAVKPYLVQTLAHNALSPSPAAFETSAEIFWLVLANLRSEFKAELAVFFTEVYFTAMDMRTATMHQRMFFMTILSRICTDPRLLVELYLNYDCDPAAPNVYERLMELLSRLSLKPAPEPASIPVRGRTGLLIDRQQIRVYDLNATPGVAISQLVAAPPVTPSQLVASLEADNYQLKTAALESLVNVLRSLVLWSQRGGQHDGEKPTMETTAAEPVSRHRPTDSTSTIDSNVESDDPYQFASRKKSKRVLDAAVQEFNFNPSRGLRKFVEAGLLADLDNATEVARLLLNTDGLDKAQLGDYLGKSNEFNQNVMVQFVGAMDFRGLSFVSALRSCLQRFRLPGEGQVIDRYMQTFAKKFYEDNSVDGVHEDFASADAAWVLAMSVMMLNTDLHASALRRRRMTDEQFIRNNKGMNDGVDFRSELLLDIYQEIQQNEIKLDSEQADVAIRDAQAFDVASDAIATRASEVFKTALPLGFTDYYNASHAAHIRPMFEISWLAILAGISNPFSQITRDEAALVVVLEGLEMALRIACQFDVGIARTSFVQTLCQNTLLSHPSHIQRKNLGALHTLLRVATTEGDSLRDSWYDVLSVISQLESLQMHNEVETKLPDEPTPEVRADLISREVVVAVDRIFAETAKMTNDGAVFFVKALARVSIEEIALPTPRLFALQKMVDVCYYNSSRIRMGWSEMWDAAMAEQFAKVLVGQNMQVVMFALDSLRQLSMRFLEIDEMPHFPFQREFLTPFRLALRHNRSPAVKVLALECLMQIVRTRADKLKSGWEAIFNTVKAAAEVPAMSVLDSAYSLLLAVPTKDKVPPGFLDACSAMAEQSEAKMALHSVELIRSLVSLHEQDTAVLQNVLRHLSEIALQGRDLEVRGRCLENLFSLLNEYGSKFDRDDWNEVFTNSLGPLFSVLHGQARRRAHHQMRDENGAPVALPAAQLSATQLETPQLETPQTPQKKKTVERSPQKSPSTPQRPNLPTLQNTPQTPQTFNELLSVPNLSASNRDVSPSRGSRGHSPGSASTASLPRSRSPSPVRTSRAARAREDLSLWLSSTLIQALKSLMALFSAYFDMLEHALPTFFLPLLKTCILQENDAVSRMGNSCLQALIHNDAERFTAQHWHEIASVFVDLFKETTATQLMDRNVIESSEVDHTDLFRSMTAKTMQALLLMSSVRELFVVSKEVLDRIPVAEILRITTRLRMSHQFAREFNHQHELRLELYQRGFFRQTPNLLHQESQAGQTFISISMRLFKDTNRFETDPAARQDIADELIPFCNQILADYNMLRESEPRHVSKFLPIVESILWHLGSFRDADFLQCAPSVYLQVIDILNKSMTPSLREAVQQILRRVADVWVLNPGEQKK